MPLSYPLPASIFMLAKGMPSFDGSFFRHVQVELGLLVKLFHTKTIANVLNKVKTAIASAFRVASPAMALA